MKFLERIIRYSKVGLLAASVHFSVQFIVGFFFPLWISNTLGFLTASIVSYLGHSLYTYRFETSGKIFPRRWLLIQFILNIGLSALLPNTLISIFGSGFLTRITLILMPILMNALIWTNAAKFTKRNL